MERKKFIQNSMIVGEVSIFPTSNARVQNIEQGGIDGHTVPRCADHLELKLRGRIQIRVIDVWERVYYLAYRNLRTEFVDCIMNIINWGNLAQRLNMALRLK